MRGLVLAMALVPMAIDERIIRAPVDAQAVLDRADSPLARAVAVDVHPAPR